MTQSAFVVTAGSPFLSSANRSWVSAPLQTSTRHGRVSTLRRVRFTMSEENSTATSTETKPDPEPESKSQASDSANPMGGPSLDTTVFSDFVESAQAKVEDLIQQVQDVDVDEVTAYGTEAGKGLMDNLLAGDWLSRGELYGALQLVFVILLLRGPSFLDGVVSLATGPLLLLLGAVVSGKGLVDLGLKQLSIWPAPVPNSSLKRDGMYDIVRHPIYSGLLLASFGFAVSTGSPSRIAISIAFTVMLIKKIEVEEEFLCNAFPDYEDYVEEVPFKILPKIY